jgi:hypothetical protein
MCDDISDLDELKSWCVVPVYSHPPQRQPAQEPTMDTYKQYRCNLCRDFILPTDGTPREGFGVHFFGYSPGDGKPWLAFKRSSECENHICLACARAVHDELRMVTPAVAERCPCGDRPLSKCPGEWEKGCDLGANEKYAQPAQEPTMDSLYGDGSDHRACEKCGFCRVCGDRDKHGCGQARTMTVTGAGAAAEERGHWYSPAAVREMVAAERERCAKVCEELQAEMTAQGTASPYGDVFARRIRGA